MKIRRFFTLLIPIITGIFTGCGSGSGKSDAQAKNPPSHTSSRFLRNLDDTVTDKITHLLWQDDSSAKTVKKSQEDAAAYCAGLKLAGREDWRLPSLDELMILAGQGRVDPAFENVAPQLYHTQTPYADKQTLAWYVNFNYGFDYLALKSTPYYVRCVAGKPYLPHLKRGGNDTVIDTTNDLMWEDDAALKESRRSWEEAKSYCKNLTLGGFTDWRLPGIDELYTITDHHRFNPAIKSPFENGLSANFWSATPAREGYIWGVNFYQGSNYYNGDEYGWLASDKRYYTRCVRSASFNEAPVATPAHITLAEDTNTTFTLQADDRDGDPLQFRIERAPAHGVLLGTPPDLIYQPDSDYSGEDSFTFIANDGAADSEVATITLTIEGVNDAPIAQSLAKSGIWNSALPITLSATDPDGDALTYRIIRSPEHGEINGTAPHLTYTPQSDYNGTDSFEFVANDGRTDSDPATIMITVTEQNEQPSAEEASVTLDEDTNRTITLNGSDPNGDPLSFVIATPPEHGDYKLDGARLSYTPDPNYAGEDRIVFRSYDGAFYSDPATLSITVNGINDTPTASDLNVTTDEDNSTAIHLEAYDADNDTLSYSYTLPSHGTLTGTAPDLIYTPAENYHGSDAFTYNVTDPSEARSQTRTVYITINSINDIPVADAGEDILADQGINLILDGTNSYDPDGTVEAYRWTEEDTELATTPTFEKDDFTPGTHLLTLTITDNNGAIATDNVIVTINPSSAISFQKHILLDNKSKPEGIYCADIDADGYDDILTADSGAGENLWLPYTHNKNFDITKTAINSDNYEGESIFAADIDNDGDIDILSGAYAVDGKPSLIWYENNGTDTFTTHPIDITLSDAAFARAADIDVNGEMDIIAGVWNHDDTDGAIAWYANDGSENFTEHIVIRGKNHIGTVVPVDLDKDGDIDLIAALNGQGAVGWYENDGSENFTEHIIDDSTPGVFGIAIGDFDHDGYPDIVASADTSGKIHWYRNDHDRSFTPHTLNVNSTNGYNHVETGDIDGDGDIDILYSIYYGGEIGWYRNDGSGNFTKETIETGLQNPSSISLSDLDFDGDLDFAVALSGERAFAWYENMQLSGSGYRLLPKTGITASVRSGDDGDLQKGAYYTYTRDTDTGIVTDHTTGLMWEDGSHTSGNNDTWSSAESYCQDLTAGGYDDWRIPEVHELYYLLDRRNTPAISSVFQNIPDDNAGYWTDKVGSYDYAWVGFQNAEIAIASLYTFPQKYIRCVRGEPLKFYLKRDDTKEIVNDYRHHLQWQDDSSVESNARNWSEAISYCQSLSLDGGGWRMPNINELYSTVDIHSSPARQKAFRYGTSDIYWSSSADGSGVVTIDFSNGTDRHAEAETNDYRIRCVRDIP